VVFGESKVARSSAAGFSKDHVDLERLGPPEAGQTVLHGRANRRVSPQISFISSKIGFLPLLGSVCIDINSLPLTVLFGLIWCTESRTGATGYLWAHWGLVCVYSCIYWIFLDSVAVDRRCRHSGEKLSVQ
jgi:hypothetical protein